MPIANVKAGEVKEWTICDENKLFEGGTLLEKIDTITFKKSVIIHDEKNYLYPTFDNKEIALQNIKIKAERILTELAEKYNLSDLTDDNWELYLNAVQNYNSSEHSDERGLLE